MEFPVMSQCKNNLNFQPVASGSSDFVTFTWGLEKLNAFELKSSSVIDLKALPEFQAKYWYDAVFKIYPKISLMEMARLRACVQKLAQENHDFNIPEQKWMAAFGYTYRDDLISLMDMLLLMPSTFQYWIAEKDLGPRELRPLLLIKNFQEYLPLIAKLIDSQPSRSESAQILELLIQLILMDTKPSTLLACLQKSSDMALVDLRSLRYPKRSLLQASMQERAAKLPWPKKTQLKWNFLKDQPSLEMKVLIQSEEEFNKLASSLVSIQEKLNQKDLNPWKI